MRSPRLRRQPAPAPSRASDPAEPTEVFSVGEAVEVFPDEGRPRPPTPSPAPHAEHAAVDALRDGAWGLGVALLGGDRAGGKVAVCFPATREEAEFDAADVRPHLEWVAGEWRSPEDMVRVPTHLAKESSFCAVASPFKLGEPPLFHS